MPEHPASSAASTVAKEELQVTADKRISISFVKQRSSSAILAVANLDRPSGSLSLAFGGVAIAALFYTSITVPASSIFCILRRDLKPCMERRSGHRPMLGSVGPMLANADTTLLRGTRRTGSR
jgi:hypothetical protein